MNTSSNQAPVDPVTVEIIRNGLYAVTEEMKTNLTRTAYNLIIYEALDFTVGLFTKEGDTVSIGLGLPMFIRGMSETVKAKIRHFGYDNIKPGDILVTNDAYTTGSHLNHFTFTMPVFHDGKLEGFTCCMAHWLDVGGTLGNVTTDIFSEGIQIPILKYQREGVVNQDLIDIIAMNVRLADRALGDLRAQITAITTGERRYVELLQRYGVDAVNGSIRQIMDSSEAVARKNTLSIPDGTYEAESFMDDDGLDVGKRVPIRVRVTVKDDEMTIDLSDVSKQVRGFYNSGFTTGIACAQVAYKCLTTPTDYPVNDGSFRPLKVIMPMGTVISAERPYPMRVWMTFPMTVIDTIFKALAPAIPNRSIAGHHADLVFPNIHGISPGGRPAVHRRHRTAGRRLGRQEHRGRRVGHRLHQRRRHPQQPHRAARGQVPGAGGEVRDPPRQRRRRPPPGRPGRRDGGAGPVAVHRHDPHRPRALQAVGPGGRHRGHGQRPGGAAQGRVEDRPPERQDLQCAPGTRRRLQDAVGRGRRLRQPAGARRRAGGRGRARRLRQPRGGARGVPCRARWRRPGGPGRDARAAQRLGQVRQRVHVRHRVGRAVTLAMAEGTAQRADALLSLWSDLSIRHVALGASCGCGVGGISVRLEDFELDIADYLEDAGIRSDDAEVAAFFRGLQDAGPRDEPLRALLADVREERAGTAVAEWLLPRVEKTLRSFAELHGPRG
jgi:hypothetical protein